MRQLTITLATLTLLAAPSALAAPLDPASAALRDACIDSHILCEAEASEGGCAAVGGTCVTVSDGLDYCERSSTGLLYPDPQDYASDWDGVESSTVGPCSGWGVATEEGCTSGPISGTAAWLMALAVLAARARSHQGPRRWETGRGQVTESQSQQLLT